MKKIIFLDTETTGIDDTDFLCQLAYKTGEEVYCELFKPEIKISIEASSVTHISNKMVADKPSFKESSDYKKIKSMLEDKENIMVAHNAKFDIGMIKKEDIIPANTICTLRVARYLDKEHKIPQHKLQYLRYYLEIEIEAQAHDALGDVMVLEKLFERLMTAIKKEKNCDDEGALKEMMDISSRPSLMHSFSFGKHNGKTVEEVAKSDRGYLEWFLNQKETQSPYDEDWIYTLRHHLGKLQ
ncbi:MAG: Exonuclease RNase and polymerase [Patescibacteria group bacterium]|nr:Exonuclease RNase and polymerase [Patescibacteria group bacterium]